VIFVRKALPHFFIVVCGSLLLVLLSLANLSAESAALITQGFQTEETNLSTGALVSLKDGTANTVELANTSRAAKLVGVVGENAFLELSDDDSSVQVVTNGAASALVSDLNGEIKAGDRITPSPIAGVGMKATQSGVIVGTASGDMTDTDSVDRTITAQDGDQQTVRIGLVPAQINVAAYITGEGDSAVPSFLQNFANAIAGRNVSPVRILVASLLTILLFASVTVLLYSAVRSSIISIGRNPLSEHALRRTLFQVGLTVFGIIIGGLLLIYAILKV
jgi:hypothetical protein